MTKNRRSLAEVAVLGATGQTGTEVVRALRAAGHSPRAIGHTRRGHGSPGWTCDLGDVGSLERALDGVAAVWLTAPLYSPDEPEYVANTVRSARRAGVQRIVLHSVLHAHTPTMPHHLRKAEAEAIVRNSGLVWTVLQSAMYAQTPLLFHAASPEGLLCAPFSLQSRFSVIDIRDVGEIAARVLTEPGHEYACYELAGADAQTFHEFAAELSALAGERLYARQVRPWDLILPDTLTLRMGDFVAMCQEYDDHGLVGNGSVAQMLLGRVPNPFAAVAHRAFVEDGVIPVRS